MKVREILRIIETGGWEIVATRGSHRQYKHPTKPGEVTVAGKPSRDFRRAFNRASFDKQASSHDRP